jgi:hypothetical protein
MTCCIAGLVIPVHAVDRPQLAERYFHVLYPELDEKLLGLMITPMSLSHGGKYYPVLNPDLRLFSMELLDRPGNDDVGGASKTCPQLVLAAYFRFSSHGDTLEELATNGPIVNGQRNRQFRDLVEKHPRWSDQRILQELSNAKANFGPDAKEDLLRKLPLKELESLLGKISVTSAEFQIVDRHGKEHQNALIQWNIAATVQFADGRELRYVFLCEPFDGKLNHIILLSNQE